MTVRIIQPDGWPRPSGYSNGIAARGTQLFVSGQIGWDLTGRIVPGGFLPQARQALENMLAVLSAGGAGPQHVVRMTWFVTNTAEYRAHGTALGAVYRELMGNHYPAMSAVGVSALVQPSAVVEIEATAVIPDA